MTIRKLYCDIDGINLPLNVSVNTSHSSNIATAIINCESISADIGDEITIDLGYSDDHDQIFTGFIKQIEKKVPEDIYTVTAYDKLVQASDYFIVSSDPDKPYNFGNDVPAEDLVQEVLELADLTDYSAQATYFEFGHSNDVEVNLVTSFDYAKMIGDIVTWHLWCDSDGTIQFRNRKPYVMTGDSDQPGDDTDERVAYGLPGSVSIGLLEDKDFINLNLTRSEKELRNRVVVFGNGGLSAEAERADSYDPWDYTYKQILPAGFYKSTVCSYSFIDTEGLAQDIADYNLLFLNRLTTRCQITTLGNPILTARSIITLNDPFLALVDNWYIFASEHSWSKNGYLCNLEVRR